VPISSLDASFNINIIVAFGYSSLAFCNLLIGKVILFEIKKAKIKIKPAIKNPVINMLSLIAEMDFMVSFSSISANNPFQTFYS
jgi:hypothetical protein